MLPATVVIFLETFNKSTAHNTKYRVKKIMNLHVCNPYHRFVLFGSFYMTA